MYKELNFTGEEYTIDELKKAHGVEKLNIKDTGEYLVLKGGNLFISVSSKLSKKDLKGSTRVVQYVGDDGDLRLMAVAEATDSWKTVGTI